MQSLEAYVEAEMRSEKWPKIAPHVNIAVGVYEIFVLGLFLCRNV